MGAAGWSVFAWCTWGGGDSRVQRIAECACGRLTVLVDGDPWLVLACHCDFCLRRTGSAYPVMAYFNKDQVLEMAGERSVYNGKAENGEAGPGGLVNHYNFCPTCGSTVFYVFDEIPEGFFPEAFERMLPDAIAFAVGSFADPDFPPPTTHANPSCVRHG